MTEQLQWFVDRAKQRAGFIKMLAGETAKAIMAVEAPSEMGKTWLIQRLHAESQRRATPVAHLDFRDRLPWDYLTIVRQIRDQLGAAYFNYLTQVINESTGINVQFVAEAVTVSVQNSQIQDSTVQLSAVPDNFQFVQVESDTIRRNIEARITDAFFISLEALAQGQMVVLLFDSVEEAAPEAINWLITNLLLRIRDQRLARVIVIMAGRELPDLDDNWRAAIARTGLDLLDESNVQEYVQLRGLVDLDLATILRTSGGHPGLLAKMADFATLEKDDKDQDWL